MTRYKVTRSDEPTTHNIYLDEDKSEDTADRSTNIVAKIIYTIGGIIITLLGLRFIFVLFGANPRNDIADFVYSASRPLVAPFFGLFNYSPTLGNARIEWETLVAILIYSILTSILVRMVSLGKR